MASRDLLLHPALWGPEASAGITTEIQKRRSHSESDLLNQNLHFSQTPRWSTYVLKFEQHYWLKANWELAESKKECSPLTFLLCASSSLWLSRRCQPWLHLRLL